MLSKKTYKSFFIITLILTLIFTVGRILSMLLDFEPNVGYYTSSSITPTLLGCVYGLFLVIIVASKAYIPETIRTKSDTNTFMQFSSAFTGFMFLAFALFYYMDNADNLNILLLLTSIGSALFFLSNLISKTSTTLKSLLALVVIAWYLINLYTVYFQLSYPVNLPAKSYNLISQAFTVLFFFYGAKDYLGMKNKNNLFVYGLVALFAISTSSIANLIYNKVYLVTDYSKFDMVQLSVFLYIIATLFNCGENKNHSDNQSNDIETANINESKDDETTNSSTTEE